MKFPVLDLFSGLGGFSLGLERMKAFKTVAFCEINPWRRERLQKNWPGVPCYEDVKNVDGKKLRGHVRVITGGFPCTDLSVANRFGRGLKGKNSGLFYEIIRLAWEIQPDYVIMENVRNLLSGPKEAPGAWFKEVLTQLAHIGYDAEWRVIPASAVGAPHRRERVWIVAYPKRSQELQARLRALGYSDEPRLERLGRFLKRARERSFWAAGISLRGKNGRFRLVPPGVPLVADGIPGKARRVLTAVWAKAKAVLRWGPGTLEERTEIFKAAGDSLVPGIPEAIGRTLLDWEKRLGSDR